MKLSKEPELLATKEDYALIFESHKVGQKILEDLTRRFAHRSKSADDGIGRVLDTFEYQGQRNVLDFICLRISQANGVDDYEDIEVSTDE
jgi:hypothetical protein